MQTRAGLPISAFGTGSAVDNELSARRAAAFARLQSIVSGPGAAGAGAGWLRMDPLARRAALTRQVLADETRPAVGGPPSPGSSDADWSESADWLGRLSAAQEEWPGEAEGGDFSGVGARTGPGVEIQRGDVVRRGPSWQWGSADGGEGGLGDVTDVTDWHAAAGAGIKVRWRRTGNIEVHRWGFEGAYDLEILPGMRRSAAGSDGRSRYAALGHKWSPALDHSDGCAAVVLATGEQSEEALSDPVLAGSLGPASGSGAAAAMLASGASAAGTGGQCSATKGAESVTGASTVWTAPHPSFRCDDDGRALMLASPDAPGDIAQLQRQSSLPSDEQAVGAGAAASGSGGAASGALMSPAALTSQAVGDRNRRFIEAQSMPTG